MTTFAGSDTWHAAISGPDPGDPIAAASVVDPDTLLADRTVFLYTRMQERYALIAAGHTVLSGTGSVIDLKAITSLTAVPNVDSGALTALEADDLIVAEADFAATIEGPAEIRYGIDHDDDPLIVSHEARHYLDTAGALIGCSVRAHFNIAGAVAAGSKVRLVARCSAAGNTTATIWRPASLRWALFRKGV